MIKKKLIHHIFFLKNNDNFIFKTSFYLQIATFFCKHLKPFNFFINERIKQLPTNIYSDIYHINLNIKTNFLFLFTLYIIYNKISKYLNLFTFKFSIILKKQQKFTILRAPCNHKNAKEQFGRSFFTGKVKTIVPFLNNRFFHNYFLFFFFTEKKSNLTKLTHKILKNENKYNK